MYIRSVYSLLSSMCTVDKIAYRASKEGYKAVALTDHHTLSGAMAFKKACEKYQIKPIYGLELAFKDNERLHNILLYARNDKGFTNLMKLSTFVSSGDKTFVDATILNEYGKDLFVVLLADDCPLTYVIDQNGDEDECFSRMEVLFGKGYLVALCDHDHAINFKRDLKIKKLLKQRGIHTLAINRTFYFDKGDEEDYLILECIRDKKTVDDPSNSKKPGRYFYSKSEFEENYDNDDLHNTDVLAEACNVKMDFKTELPVYENKFQAPSGDYLVSLCKAGLKARLKGRTSLEYEKRLDYELSVILKMHFEDYFLIVYDFILFAKKNGIMVGPGRGSAAGSLVSYCLGITDIDPIRYGLLFERFLNPERVSMPDIDTDFPDDRRGELFAYLARRYGKDHVAHIITFGTLKAKQVIRDVGSALGYRTAEIDAICKTIPFAYESSLAQAYESAPLFRQRIESDERYRRLYKIAQKLEGFPRNPSTHAAGVVLSRKPFNDVIPLVHQNDDMESTQYSAEYLEELGLIKIDILGLKNLGIIKEIVDDINIVTPFDIRNIPLDDSKTFDLICNVDTLGIFQLESAGMRNTTRSFKPRSLEQIGALIALFRPGPMKNIPLFIENKNHPERIRYLHKDLEDILKETYGVIVYQEQIMMIARKMASFSYGKADILRKAMSKKKADILEGLKNEFVAGCLANGYSREVTENVYDLILEFANYGFNKSHSIAYGTIAYQLAYLKANYPAYFYKALLNGTTGSESKTYEYLSEARKRRIPMSIMSLNHSGTKWIVYNRELLMPLVLCRDVGQVLAIKIIKEREERGPFRDYVEAVVRLSGCGVDKKAIENLICAGAFDEFKHSRFTMTSALGNVLKYADAHKGEISLIDDEDDAPLIKELKDDKIIRAQREKEVLGFYFSFNPMDAIRQQYNIATPSLENLGQFRGNVKGFGLITRVKDHKTKKGEMMAFVDVSDETGSLSLSIMPNLLQAHLGEIAKDRYIYFEGKVDRDNSCLPRMIKVY